MEHSIYQVLLTDISYYFIVVSIMTVFWNRIEAYKEAKVPHNVCMAQEHA